MRIADHYRPGLSLVLCMLLAACASAPQQPVANASRTPPAPQPKDPQSACAWSQTRGIAILLATTGNSGERQGTWQFFPGDDILHQLAPDGANQGDEYKALLKRPLSGPCSRPILLLIAPI